MTMPQNPEQPDLPNTPAPDQAASRLTRRQAQVEAYDSAHPGARQRQLELVRKRNAEKQAIRRRRAEEVFKLE